MPIAFARDRLHIANFRHEHLPFKTKLAASTEIHFSDTGVGRQFGQRLFHPTRMLLQQKFRDGPFGGFELRIRHRNSAGKIRKAIPRVLRNLPHYIGRVGNRAAASIVIPVFRDVENSIQSPRNPEWIAQPPRVNFQAGPVRVEPENGAVCLHCPANDRRSGLAKWLERTRHRIQFFFVGAELQRV